MNPLLHNSIADVHEAARLLEAARALPVDGLDAWQPIETAPDDELVVVFYTVTEGDNSNEFHTLDFKEDGSWFYHGESYEHFRCVAPAGSEGPSEIVPYTHWKRLGAPIAKQQEPS